MLLGGAGQAVQAICPLTYRQSGHWQKSLGRGKQEGERGERVPEQEPQRQERKRVVGRDEGSSSLGAMFS